MYDTTSHTQATARATTPTSHPHTRCRHPTTTLGLKTTICTSQATAGMKRSRPSTLLLLPQCAVEAVTLARPVAGIPKQLRCCRGDVQSAVSGAHPAKSCKHNKVRMRRSLRYLFSVVPRGDQPWETTRVIRPTWVSWLEEGFSVLGNCDDVSGKICA